MAVVQRFPTQRMQAANAALAGQVRSTHTRSVGFLSWYQDRPSVVNTHAVPLVLIHSISAASSAYDMKPVYDYFRGSRPVYAIDLPGFGLSERSDRRYTPQLMSAAILELLAQIRLDCGDVPVDAMALSLSCEFLARAAAVRGERFRSVALVSPTGFEGTELREATGGGTRGKPWLYTLLSQPLWRRRIYELLTRPAVIGYFLRRTFGSRNIDGGLLRHDIDTSTVPGAEFAPLSFLAGCLFSKDSGHLYRALQMPVWVLHGVRGAFGNAPGLARMAARPNWHVELLPTGAMPQFEMLPQFVDRYMHWLVETVGEVAVNGSQHVFRQRA